MDAKRMGCFIARIRKEKKMTQAELAEKLHVTDKAVSRWERGVGFPDIEMPDPAAGSFGGEEKGPVYGLHLPDNIHWSRVGHVRNFVENVPVANDGAAGESGWTTGCVCGLESGYAFFADSARRDADSCRCFSGVAGETSKRRKTSMEKEKTKKIKLLAVDMDGTCLDRRSRMSEETIQALKAARDAGMIIVPTTGRNLHCLPHRLAAEKSLYRYVISSNGARVTDCLTGRTLFESMIPREEALHLLRDIKGIKAGITAHIGCEYLIQGRILVMLGHLMFGKDARGVYHVKNMKQVLRSSGQDVEELQLYFLSVLAKRQLQRILALHPLLTCASTSVYMEIFSRNTSKGMALHALAKELGIRKEEIACMGDGENDLYMFQEAGFKMAMGNAVPDLKKKADVILPSNDRNGAARGIQKYLLS